MTAKQDWPKILSMFTLGGYNVSAVLSDSTALLSLIGLTLLDQESMWADFTDSDDIESAIAKAIYELTTGDSVVSDYEKIGEKIQTSDAVSVTCDIDAGGDWTSFDVIMSGLRSNRAAQVSGNGLIWVNGNTVAANYNSVVTYYTGSATARNDQIGSVAGFWIPYGTAGVLADSGCWANIKMTILNPLNDDRKTHVFWTNGLSGQTTGEPRGGNGSGIFEVVDPIESISINPQYGTTFLVDPANTAEPSELTIRVYGRK